jgi:hypothetical protein
MKANLRMNLSFSALGLAAAAATALFTSACGTNVKPTATSYKQVMTHKDGDVIISLASENGELQQGEDHFMVTFQSAANNQAIDPGTVTISSSMSMPGMTPMVAAIELKPAGQVGSYTADGTFGMSGAWKFELRWDGPAGQGSSMFTVNVR